MVEDTTKKSARDEFADYRGPDEASFDKMVQALDRAYHRPLLMMGRAFLHGMMSAIGAAVGAALIVAISGYLFSRVGGTSILKTFVQDIASTAGNTIQKQIGDGAANQGNN